MHRLLMAKIDCRSSVFFRIAFGLLMMVYSTNKCTDKPFHPDRMVYFDYSHITPSYIYEMTDSFPWYTNSLLYWQMHGPLMLLSAMWIACGFGISSRVGCVVFALLTFVLLVQDQTKYNNHEYLYSTTALSLAFCDCHQYSLSLCAALIEALDGRSRTSNSNSSSSTTGKSPWRKCKAQLVVTGITGGVLYLMLNVAVYGIAGHIAVVGMSTIYICLTLWLGRDGNRDSNEQVNSLPRSHSGDSNSKSNDCCTVSQRSWHEHEHEHERWNSIFLQLFVCVVYFYAGVAKLEVDWLSGSTFLELVKNNFWLPAYLRALEEWNAWGCSALHRACPSILSQIIAAAAVESGAGIGVGIGDGAGNTYDAAAISSCASYATSSILAAIDMHEEKILFFFAYSGMLLDILAGIFLPFFNCWTHIRGWRVFHSVVLFSAFSFHVMNHFLFVIESFPWFMISTCVLYVDPVWMDVAVRGTQKLLSCSLWGQKRNASSQQQQQHQKQRVNHALPEQALRNSTATTTTTTTTKFTCNQVDDDRNVPTTNRTEQLFGCMWWWQRVLAPALLVMLLLLHIFIPFRCAWTSAVSNNYGASPLLSLTQLMESKSAAHNNISPTASLVQSPASWDSRCQYFCWKMMTRVGARIATTWRVELTTPPLSSNNHSAPYNAAAATATAPGSKVTLVHYLPTAAVAAISLCHSSFAHRGYTYMDMFSRIDSSSSNSASDSLQKVTYLNSEDGGQVEGVYIEIDGVNVPLCSAARQFSGQGAMYENRAWRVAREVKLKADQHLFELFPMHLQEGGSKNSSRLIASAVYIDTWLQLNGPPMQRFTNPFVNAGAYNHFPALSRHLLSSTSTSTSTASSSSSATSSSTTYTMYTPWSVPRITTYRTFDWLQTFRVLEKHEKKRLRDSLREQLLRHAQQQSRSQYSNGDDGNDDDDYNKHDDGIGENKAGRPQQLSSAHQALIKERVSHLDVLFIADATFDFQGYVRTQSDDYYYYEEQGEQEEQERNSHGTVNKTLSNIFVLRQEQPPVTLRILHGAAVVRGVGLVRCGEELTVGPGELVWRVAREKRQVVACPSTDAGAGSCEPMMTGLRQSDNSTVAAAPGTGEVSEEKQERGLNVENVGDPCSLLTNVEYETEDDWFGTNTGTATGPTTATSQPSPHDNNDSVFSDNDSYSSTHSSSSSSSSSSSCSSSSSSSSTVLWMVVLEKGSSSFFIRSHVE